LKSPGNILIVTYWSYQSALIKTYTLPYVDIIRQKLPAGSMVYLLTLTPASQSAEEEYQRTYDELKARNIILVNFTYRRFGFAMVMKMMAILLFLLRFIYTKKIRVIHAWCTPGGAIGYVLSLITGRKLVLDSFEPHAESMRETGTWKKNSLAYRLLFKLEKLQLRRASHVICAAEGMIVHSQQTYGIVKDHYFVKPACVDLSLFNKEHMPLPLSVSGIEKDSVVCVYAGKFGDIYLSQEVFDFFRVAASFWGIRFKVLLLTNHTDEEIAGYCRVSGLAASCIIKKFVPHADVPKYMALGNFGICPVKSVPTKKYCTPIKNGEYWAMGLPVVITKDISVDSDLIAGEEIGYVLQNLSDGEYAHAVKKIDELIKSPGINKKIRKVAEQYRSFDIADRIYTTIYGGNSVY
jgi:glycosyltransferase involved in cell wall biosynthesis